MDNKKPYITYYDRSVPITEYLENENNIAINDCNKYCYSMGPMHLADSLDKILQLAARTLDNFQSFSFHVEPLSPLLSPYIITDALWFQENLLCLIEQCISSSFPHQNGLFQIVVRLVNDNNNNQTYGNSYSSPNKHRREFKSPRTPVSLDSPACSRPQSLIIPQRPSALNYSSRSHSTASPRTMRATIAFSPKYLSPQASLNPEIAECLPNSQKQQHYISSSPMIAEEPLPMLRFEIVQPFSTPSTTLTKMQLVAKYPVHTMQRRIHILGGSYKAISNSSNFDTFSDNNSNNVYFCIPFHPASDQDLSSAQQNLLSGKTLSHISLLHDEHPIFTPTHKVSKTHHKVPVASLPLHKILDVSSPHSSLPHTPIATWKAASSSSDSSSNSSDDDIIGIGLSTSNLNHLLSGKSSSSSTASPINNSNLRIDVMSNKTIPINTKNNGESISSILRVKNSVKIPRKSFNNEEELSFEQQCLNTPVILVDDSTLVLKLTRTVLERSGYVVQVAKNGLEAVQTICDLIAERSISDNKPATLPVVLMDLQMPVLDGIEAVRRIRSVEESLLLEEKLTSDLLEDYGDNNNNDFTSLSFSCNNMKKKNSQKKLVILALSANNHDTIVQEALDAGCDAFLQKPFNLEDFQQVMQQILCCDDDFDE